MTARARRMLAGLEDGTSCTRMRDASYLTNNAAAELRAAGVGVTYLRVDGLDTYLLDEPEGTDPAPQVADLRLIEQANGQFALEVAA